MGVLHAVQAVAVLALANDFALPVIGTFMTGPPGAADPVIEPLFEVSLAWGVAVFLFMSSAAHFVISMPGVFPWYVRNLESRRNYARWIEYSFSSSVMVVLIAMLVGISDIAALLRPPARVGVEVFQREADGIHDLVAARARRAGAVPRHLLPQRQRLAVVARRLFQRRHVRRRLRRRRAQEVLQHPHAALHR
jgi:hypothetical protein